jgi:hypothetical protein
MTLNSLLRLSFAAAFLAFLPSCRTTSEGMTGQTQYLDMFAPGSVPSSNNAEVDNVSYWDGDSFSGPARIVLDLSDQKAYFYKGEHLAGVSMICSGDENHRTVTGNFKIFEKDRWHKSNLYGDFVDGAGNVVKPNVDVTKDKAPPGTKFDGSKMHWFMRFNGGAGMHEGFMAGYPASHGCVRMPTKMADIFFQNVQIGTPVRVQP